jgi:REP element-mobilizing transposase RayT
VHSAAHLHLTAQNSDSNCVGCLYKVSLIGYCLMSNHIHLIAVPRTADGLAQALKHTHGRDASYWT